MLYFAYLPKTTIADIIPVLVAGFDKKFVKPCMPYIAEDGTLYYKEHEQYVIDNSIHPLKFRSVDWNSKKQVLQEWSKQNTFVGSYKNHISVLKNIDNVSIAVHCKLEYHTLLAKQAEMFNKYHDSDFKIKDIDLLLEYDAPDSDYNFDLLDLFSEQKMINFMHQLGTYNKIKHQHLITWLTKLKSNKDFAKLLVDIEQLYN